MAGLAGVHCSGIIGGLWSGTLVYFRRNIYILTKCPERYLSTNETAALTTLSLKILKNIFLLFKYTTRQIHNEAKRMPLIIPPDDREGWLLAKGKNEIQSFFKPFDGLLQAHKTYRVTADRTGQTNRPDIQDVIL